MIKCSTLIQQGANTFLFQEYIYIAVFIVFFSIIILIIDSIKAYTMIAFILGSLTSIVSGYIGMYVATRANSRVTFMAATNLEDNTALQKAFNVAFRGGSVMGFILVSLALAILALIIIIYMGILYFLSISYSRSRN